MSLKKRRNPSKLTSHESKKRTLMVDEEAYQELKREIEELKREISFLKEEIEEIKYQFNI